MSEEKYNKIKIENLHREVENWMDRWSELQSENAELRAKAKQLDDRFKAACAINEETENSRLKLEAEIARLKERILAIKNVNNSVPAALMEGGEQMNDKTPEPTCRTVTLWACPRCGHEYESREEAKRCCWSYYNPSTIYVLSRPKSRAMYQEDSK